MRGIRRTERLQSTCMGPLWLAVHVAGELVGGAGEEQDLESARGQGEGLARDPECMLWVWEAIKGPSTRVCITESHPSSSQGGQPGGGAEGVVG